MASVFETFQRRVVQADFIQPVALFLLLAILITGLKVARLDQQFGDTAMYLQVIENIATRGQPVSNVFAANDEIGKRQLAVKTASELMRDPLPPMPSAEESHFDFHANYIYYPIALLSRLVPADLILMALFGFSFAGLLLLVYFAIRSAGAPITAAGLFCLLVVTHPVWTDGLEWQFYPERIFVFAGFLLLYLATRPEPRRNALLATALLCMLVSERAAVIGGLCLLLYVGLYWTKGATDRYFKAGLGIAMFGYGYFILKMVLTNREYGTFLPTSLHGVLANLTNPAIVPSLDAFIIVNAFLLVLALFEWRALIIAVVMMMPNIVGNLGGAEKVGWSTHYHDLYFPVLVWAAMTGFVRLYRMSASAKRLPVFYGAIALLILALGSIDPYVIRPLAFDPANLRNSFIPRFAGELETYLGPQGRALLGYREQMRAFVPRGAVVSAPEWAFPALYSGRHIEFYPIDVDHADYAVLTESVTPKGVTYQGLQTLLGPAEQQSINAGFEARMRRDGYDFAHALVLPTGAVIVKRIHSEAV